jgi:hypothetical protein
MFCGQKISPCWQQHQKQWKSNILKWSTKFLKNSLHGKIWSDFENNSLKTSGKAWIFPKWTIKKILLGKHPSYPEKPKSQKSIFWWILFGCPTRFYDFFDFSRFSCKMSLEMKEKHLIIIFTYQIYTHAIQHPDQSICKWKNKNHHNLKIIKTSVRSRIFCIISIKLKDNY